MTFKEDTEIETDDFYYDLFETGRIKPSSIIKGDFQLYKIEEAIEIIKEFKEELEKQEKIIYY